MGKLYIVATPIGNLQDFSFRALETLNEVDLILAEDTRHSQKLLQHYKIKKPLRAWHEYNERANTAQLIAELTKDLNVALIGDAGTPLISDPGYHLVNAALAAGITVIPIPGACAAITALSAAGLPTDRFIFEGFLPAKSGARIERLNYLSNEERTLIFYLATHDLIKILTEMAAIFGAERQASLAKELTKIHEAIIFGNFTQILAWLQADPARCQGEFVLLVAGQTTPAAAENELEALRILKILQEFMPDSSAITAAAKITGLRKNKLYELALNLSHAKKN